MVLIIFALVLVLGIAFYQAVQGAFSAMIMALLTIACALLAINYYEPLAEWLLYSGQPEFADASTLIALFAVPLLILRIFVDRLIPGNMLLGQWPDRIAGGCLGLVTGLVCTGILMLALQMLPWNDSVMGYRPFDDTLHRQQSLAPLYPDEFTLGMANTFSTGSMAADPENPWKKQHDDLLLDLHCSRNTGKDSTGAEMNLRGEVMTNSLEVVGVYEPPQTNLWEGEAPPYPLATDADKRSGDKTLVVRCSVAENAKEKKRGMFYLAATQFRLVTKSGRSFYPVGYLTYLPAGSTAYKPRGDKSEWILYPAPVDNNGKAQLGQVVVARSGESGKPLIVDWVFRLPAKDALGNDDPLAYMAFRRIARDGLDAHFKVIPSMPPTKDALDRKGD